MENYELQMKERLAGVKPGDTIKCKGTEVVIAEIISDEYYVETGWMIEFRDTENVLRNWKQVSDGGELVRTAPRAKHYMNDVDGKRELIEDLIKPLMLALDMGWSDVQYITSKTEFVEEVKLINQNSDKTITVNVWADSKRSMLEDIMRAVFRY